MVNNQINKNKLKFWEKKKVMVERLRQARLEKEQRLAAAASSTTPTKTDVQMKNTIIENEE